MKGLRGKFVKSKRTNMPRFLHPKELAALLCLPISVEFDLNLRSALCLLGNLACPLQSLWSYLFMLNAVALHDPGLLPLDPVATIKSYRCEILQQVRQCFPFAEECGAVDFTLFHCEGQPVHLLSFGSASIASLLGAEAISLDWGPAPETSG